MQQLVVLDNPRLAQAFVDYMRVKRVSCEVKEEGFAFGIWLLDEQHVELARTELEAFLANPSDDKYLEASWHVGESKRFDYGPGGTLILQNFFFHAGPVTLSIFFASVAIYVLSFVGLFPPIYQALSFFHQGADFGSGEIWRFFTPSVLHFSALHIIFNALWWWYLGGQIEREKGSGKLLLIFAIASFIPNTVQFFISGPNFGGLSGVVYAIAGYVWLSGVRKPEGGLGLPNAFMGFLLVWMVLGFFEVIGPAMANMVHLFGLGVGLLQAALDTRGKEAS